jgi:hypothetical protein
LKGGAYTYQDEYDQSREKFEDLILEFWIELQPIEDEARHHVASDQATEPIVPDKATSQIAPESPIPFSECKTISVSISDLMRVYGV